MIPERWQRVREVLARAIELPDSRRPAYLLETCGTDQSLRAEVESLLHSHAAAGRFMEGLAVQMFAQAEAAATPEPDSRVGQLLGPYRLEAEIGRGGMGEVYRAVRSDGQYQQRVAIKLLRRSAGPEELLARFRQERQILAALNHSCIARLYDGGTTDDGLPYLVMELVEGERIDTWCAARQLPVPERLRVFLQVCEAVQYAHQRLVIHRDLKPANILINAEGIPKLLDFGLAKLLQPDSNAVETTYWRPMTPAYASPEQVRGLPLTTASDVYSLGVVLYELLAGTSPYRVRDAGTLQLAQAVTGEEVRRPSATVPPRLRRQLAGDLDAIVLKALRKEPERRYASVQQLADDLQAHLHGAPVSALRGSWRYRAGKFVARNRLAVGAALAIAATLAIGITVSLRETRVARAERARAQARFEDVRQLANSLIFDVNAAMADAPGNTSARRLLLDRAVLYLDRLASDAGGDIALQRELAWGYQKLAAVQGNTTEANVGAIHAADASLHKANVLFATVARAEPGNATDALNLAMSDRQMAGSDVYYPQGLPEIRRALAITARLAQAQPDNTAVLSEQALEYSVLASAQDFAGERAASVHSLEQALTLANRTRQLQPGLPGIGHTIGRLTVRLGDQLGRAGRLDDAEQRLVQGIGQLASLQAAGASADLQRNLAHSRLILARLQLMRGDTPAAGRTLSIAATAIEQLQRADPDNAALQWDAIGLAFERGRVLLLEGQAAAAAAQLALVQARYQAPVEDDSGPGLGLLRAWQGELLLRTGDLRAALDAFRESIAALSEQPLYADARAGIAADYVRMGALQLRLGQPTAAEQDLEQALKAADLPAVRSSGDIPGYYAIADAYAGMGDVAMARLGLSAEAGNRERLRSAACAHYALSASAWRAASPAARFSPSQFPSGQPASVLAALAACRPAERVATGRS